MKKLGFIGCGNMGKAMLQGALDGGFAHREDVIVSTKSQSDLDKIQIEYEVNVTLDNVEVAAEASIIVIAVKPNIYLQVIEEIRAFTNPDAIIISVAPNFTIETLERAFNDDEIKIVRTMPNTPALVQAGITAVSFPGNITPFDKQTVLSFLKSFGEAVEVPEEQMVAVGSVSGSSPAFIYMLIEAMADGAVKYGMTREAAYLFAAKAVEGSAKMVMETGLHPGVLKDQVTSPGGTTIEGVLTLEKNGFKGNIVEAMEVTADKFSESMKKSK